MTHTIQPFIKTHRADDVVYALTHPAYFKMTDEECTALHAFVFAAIDAAVRHTVHMTTSQRNALAMRVIALTSLCSDDMHEAEEYAQDAYDTTDDIYLTMSDEELVEDFQLYIENIGG